MRAIAAGKVTRGATRSDVRVARGATRSDVRVARGATRSDVRVATISDHNGMEIGRPVRETNRNVLELRFDVARVHAAHRIDGRRAVVGRDVRHAHRRPRPGGNGQLRASRGHRYAP